MTGPEHYREAERLLAEAADAPRGVVTSSKPLSVEQAESIKAQVKRLGWGTEVAVTGPPIRIDLTPLLLAAQVHATLALAAATANDIDSLSWFEATS